MSADSQGATHPVSLILAWGFVGIPLAWGVYKTVVSALALFS